MSKENDLSLSDIVSVATFAVAVITAWLYMIGWTYAYQYFLRFRISLLMIDIPLQHYLVYGGLVLSKNVWLSLGAVVVALVLAWICVQFSARLGRFVVSMIVLTMIVWLFLTGRFISITMARTDFLHQYQNDYPAYPRVAVILKKEANEAIGDRLGDIAKTDCGRLVLFSAGRLFLIRPVRGVATAEPDSFVLPSDQLQALRLMDDYQSCE